MRCATFWLVRTTVSIPDALLAKARRRAAQEDITLSELVEAALRERLLATPVPPPSTPFRLITFGRGGTQPGVSYEGLKHLTDDEDLLRVMHLRGSRAADGDVDP